ncbi:hypothetical protein Bhyg_12187 [Pseudolycoriella hygida]|uniref:Uncharacterized protein n=1 Tax=Pseudolycoriella hygida TaxID=35572 RepID=A0A9Q0MWS4_9DIPT|nr:hypothetical protein Bhyg_12187 [Pseudolycoriella hygida]
MALTNAERKKRYIEKLKADGKYGEFLKENRLKIGLQQLPKCVREKTKRLDREYNRKKTARWRARKRESGRHVDQQPEQQSEARASRNEKRLDKSSWKSQKVTPAFEKKKFVVKKILKSFDPEDVQEMINEIHPKKVGKRDCRKLKDPVTGDKETKQIRYLMHKLSDFHQLFLKHMENGEQCTSVGISKFSSLRPTHVKLMNCTPFDQ